MKRNEYLKLVFTSKTHLIVEWWVRALTEFVENSNQSTPTTPYLIVRQPWGYGFVLPDGKIEPLEDSPLDKAPFSIFDKVDVDPQWLPNIKAPLSTDLGILGANALLLAEPFGKKIDFINGEISIETIEETIIAPRLTSNPKPGEAIDLDDPEKIYVFENNNMSKGIEFISTIMELFTVALTKKTLLPPPGIDEYKKKLLSDPNFNINDPVQLAAFEQKLLEFDARYLKDDPSYGKFASGKILKDSRKKLFLSLGAEGGFNKDGSITGIASSLDDGVPTDPKTYCAIINGGRSGSFSRGAETADGGVAAKRMLAALANYVIEKGDCGSTMGITRLYTKWLVKSLRGRTIINGKDQIKVPMNADTSQYLGKVIKTRSPLYCKLTGERVCQECVGMSMSRYPNGIALPLTEISHSILIARMKAMHTNALTVNKFDLDTLFT